MGDIERRPRPARRPRWAPPELPIAPTRSQRRLRALHEIESMLAMRSIWDRLCESTGLTGRIAAAGLILVEPPLMGPISLGPPTRFSVELPPGLMIDDIIGLGRRLAAAYRVDDIVVRPLADGWITVELIEDLSRAAGPADTAGPVTSGPPDGAPSSPSSEGRPVRRGPHLGRRGRRRPYGRPHGFGGGRGNRPGSRLTPSDHQSTSATGSRRRT